MARKARKARNRDATRRLALAQPVGPAVPVHKPTRRLDDASDPGVDRPRCSGEHDDGIGDGNLTACSPSSGCGLPGCPYKEPKKAELRGAHAFEACKDGSLVIYATLPDGDGEPIRIEPHRVMAVLYACADALAGKPSTR